MSLPYMLLTAAVAKTPNIAVTVTVTGAPMSWLKTGARLVLAKRVQSDCLCSVRFCIFLSHDDYSPNTASCPSPSH
jgi:hypothetical protein